MKASTTKRKSAIRQRADSRNEPLIGETSRSQTTPDGERKSPATETTGLAVESFRAKSARSRAATAVRESAEQGRSAAVDGTAPEPEKDSGTKHALNGFHLPQDEARKAHLLHEKGHVEADKLLSRIPPAKSLGQPGSPPRIMQRRAVYERGNRYPLTHAPKS